MGTLTVSLATSDHIVKEHSGIPAQNILENGRPFAPSQNDLMAEIISPATGRIIPSSIITGNRFDTINNRCSMSKGTVPRKAGS